MINEVVVFLEKYVAEYGYIMAFALSLLENSIFLGAMVPGEITAIITGFYAGKGVLSYPVLIILIMTGSIIGDNIGFLLGRHLGRKWLLKTGPTLGYRKEKIERAEKFWSDHGSKAIFFGRFIAFARTFIPFLAGTSKIKHSTFFIFCSLGATFHAIMMVTLGYFFGENWELISTSLGTVGIVFLIIFIAVLYKYLAKKGAERVEAKDHDSKK